MSLCLVRTRALLGLRAVPVTVEVHLANGLPAFTLVGLADTEVKESRERVRAALLSSGLDFPHNKRVTVNLAPADLPKDSGRFDLPIAVGLLAASGQIDAGKAARYEFAGELSLSGELRPVRGALAISLALQAEQECSARNPADHPAPAPDAVSATGEQPAPLMGASPGQPAPSQLVLPPGSAEEAALVPGAQVWRARHLSDVVAHLQADTAATADPPDPAGWQRLAPRVPTASPGGAGDLADVKGQTGARRALEIAAAGGHSLLMVGPPGSGKSMLAQRFAGLLPDMSLQECLESAAVSSLAGHFDLTRWSLRPTRAPHHSASAVALVGGGSPPRPGEVSLAHHGVLFLDELPEFPRSALEALREPLESGHITISRAARSAQFPARFQLVAAMNPCPCGWLGAAQRACRCTPEQIARYQSRLSGPLLDRIDLQVEVPALGPQDLLQAQAGEGSETVRTRCSAARARAQARQGYPNQALSGSDIDRHAGLSAEAGQFLQRAATRLGWSARATHRTLKVARTIADLADAAQVDTAHVAEAVQYRRALPGAS